tara:strand:+ start:2290 stop:3591 length:1302 start_codon:yes stop_codon:yes gene_type:complete
MKIKNISVENYKAVDYQEIALNGCSAIITAGNDKGKTSLLRGLIDRLRGEKPEVIVKEGKLKGFNIMELTDGSRIEWKFTDKTENFAFITPEGIKMTTGVLSAIGEKYFGNRFNIDQFLNSQPKQQLVQVQKLVGLDFTNIDARYKTAFDSRTVANRIFKETANKKLEEPIEISKPDVEAITTEKSNAKLANEGLKDQWVIDNQAHQKAINEFNDEQDNIEQINEYALENWSMLNDIKPTILGEAIDFDKAKEIIDNVTAVQEKKILTTLAEPKYKDIDEIDERLTTANASLLKFQNYERDLKDYNDWVDAGKKAREEQDKKDKAVKKIEGERKKMIQDAKIPDEFEITEDGILYKGLPLTDNQVSSSAKVIAGLKLGSLVLGKIRTLHFDASFLDNTSLVKIQEWAVENDLQLLIERPDLEAGDIRYEIIEK